MCPLCRCFWLISSIDDVDCVRVRVDMPRVRDRRCPVGGATRERDPPRHSRWLQRRVRASRSAHKALAPSTGGFRARARSALQDLTRCLCLSAARRRRAQRVRQRGPETAERRAVEAVQARPHGQRAAACPDAPLLSQLSARRHDRMTAQRHEQATSFSPFSKPSNPQVPPMMACYLKGARP